MATDNYQKHSGISLGQGWPQGGKKVFSASSLYFSQCKMELLWFWHNSGQQGAWRKSKSSKFLENQSSHFPLWRVEVFASLWAGCSICSPPEQALQAGALPHLHRSRDPILQNVLWLRASCAWVLKQHFSQNLLSFGCAGSTRTLSRAPCTAPAWRCRGLSGGFVSCSECRHPVHTVPAPGPGSVAAQPLSLSPAQPLPRWLRAGHSQSPALGQLGPGPAARRGSALKQNRGRMGGASFEAVAKLK